MRLSLGRSTDAIFVFDSSSLSILYWRNTGGIGASSVWTPFFHNFFFMFIFFLFRPGVQFHCDILYDPFIFMEEHKKIYCMFFFSCLPAPSSLRSLQLLRWRWSNTNKRSQLYGSMSWVRFSFFKIKTTYYWLLFQISLMTIQNTSPKTIHYRSCHRIMDKVIIYVIVSTYPTLLIIL